MATKREKNVSFLIANQNNSIELVSRPTKVVVKSQSFEAHEINTVIPSMLSAFINDLPRNSHRSLVNIYADATSVYGRTDRYLDAKSFATDLSSVLTSQWGKNWLVTFKT